MFRAHHKYSQICAEEPDVVVKWLSFKGVGGGLVLKGKRHPNTKNTFFIYRIKCAIYFIAQKCKNYFFRHFQTSHLELQYLNMPTLSV